MKIAGRAVVLLFGIAWLVGCATGPDTVPDVPVEVAQRLRWGLPAYPQARILVFSDPHVYDSSLGTSGSAFEDYLLRDRKLLAESAELLTEAVRRMSGEKADFVIVAGDLTKDGEAASHGVVQAGLGELEAAGLPVYVVPGNHDIANPHALRYSGDETEPVESVSPDRFREIYRRFGFDESIAEDPASLSYVAEPLPGLWLFALDSCRYRENKDHPVTGGRFESATMTWIQGMLDSAVREGKAVMAVMHHGILEHYEGQKKFHSEYVVDDHEALSRFFAGYGVRIVFTGHYHAQDVTIKRWEEKDRKSFLCDIETGSLVTSPHPYRLVKIASGGRLTVRSRFIDRIDSHPENFLEYSGDYLEAGLGEVVAATLMGYGVFERSARIIAPQVAAAIMAHYAGDETAPARILTLSGVGLWGRVVAGTRRYFLDGLWNDLAPPDNDLVIYLESGEWE